MHALKPNTKYKIVPVKLAIPDGIGEAEICDGLNEMLRAACNENFIADWAFPFATEEGDCIFLRSETGDDPEEGEVFSGQCHL